MHKKQKAGIIVGILSGLLIGAYGLQAQAQNAPAPIAKKKRKVNVKSETYTEKPTPQGNIRTLLGSVRITSEDTTLTTDKAVYNEDTGVATSPGKLQLNDQFNTLTATTGEAYYKTRDARFRGNVVIVARPRPEDQNRPKGSARRQFDAPATITSNKVNYNWRTRVAQIFDGMTIKQKDRTVIADKGTYDARSETAVLDGNVKYTKPNGDWATAKKIVMILKEGAEEFTATGTVNGSFDVPDEDEPATPTAPPTAAPPPGRPGVRPSTPRPIPGTPPATPPSETPPANGGEPTTPEAPPANGGGATP